MAQMTPFYPQFGKWFLHKFRNVASIRIGKLIPQINALLTKRPLPQNQKII